MTLAQYQQEAKRTCADLEPIGRSNACHMKIGIFTECGELLDAIKKYYAYQKPIDLVNVGEEIGDIMFYVANKTTFYNFSFAQIADGLEPDGSIDSYERLIDELVELPTLSIASTVALLLNVCKFFKLDLYELLDRNIAKLKSRYPEKFTTENALNRDLEKEREILSGKAF